MLLSDFGGCRTIASRLQPVVWIEEQQIGRIEHSSDRIQPIASCLLANSNWHASRNELARERSNRKYARVFQRMNVPLARQHDLTQSIEEVWIELAPSLWTVQVAVVPALADEGPITEESFSLKPEPSCQSPYRSVALRWPVSVAAFSVRR